MPKNEKPKVRRWTKADIPGLVRLHDLVYPDFSVSDRYDSRIFQLELEKFPEGQFLVEIGGKIVAYACSIIVLLGDSDEYYTARRLLAGGHFPPTTHLVTRFTELISRSIQTTVDKVSRLCSTKSAKSCSNATTCVAW